MTQCQCGCGKETGVYAKTRKERGQVEGAPKVFLSGHKPYRWEAAPPKQNLNPDIPIGLCQCGCGGKTEIATGLKTANGYTKGQPKFFILGHSPLKHGQTRRGKITPEYRAYTNAQTRCTNPRRKDWKNYGGRGIRFLFTSFEQFFEEIGVKPQGYILDRRNNDGHYEPGNVRWVTRKESNRNRRRWKCQVKQSQQN
jgi:hypothetical protein